VKRISRLHHRIVPLVVRSKNSTDADVIEAVGEGVIFNHLGHIMDTHINRLLVLRPKVNRDERTHEQATKL
jgi:hypothetical protein